MPDSTKELLDAHHAQVLRELDRVYVSVSGSLSDIKHDMSGIRSKMDDRAETDNARFGEIENKIGVLGWAYGVGVFIVGCIFALLKLGKL